MSLAGIWTSWRAGTPEEQRSFSIMTTAANAFMEKIHDRMPVILDAKQFDEWLDPEVHEAGADRRNAEAVPGEVAGLQLKCPRW